MERTRLTGALKLPTRRLMKLYRTRYSPYARKVQMLLDLLGQPYDAVEMAYGDRTELATVTGGYVYVPVLVDDDGTVTVESRDICEKLLAGDAGRRLVPAPFEGPIWAYADFADGPLEDVLFRIASPAIRDGWKNPGERALYVLIKERKFGAGCVTAWERTRDALVARGRHLLAPTLRTLAARPFLFGDAPTLADAALYGECAMLEAGDPALLERVSPELVAFMRRVEQRARPA
jgi:glutathione S-transferase